MSCSVGSPPSGGRRLLSVSASVDVFCAMQMLVVSSAKQAGMIRYFFMTVFVFV